MNYSYLGDNDVAIKLCSGDLADYIGITDLPRQLKEWILARYPATRLVKARRNKILCEKVSFWVLEGYSVSTLIGGYNGYWADAIYTQLRNDCVSV